MSTSFQSTQSLLFSQLGSTGTGANSQLFNTATGETLLLAQTPLNYVIGSGLGAFTSGGAVANGVLSLTVTAGRIVEIGLQSTSGATTSAVRAFEGAVAPPNCSVFLIRGPSTLIGNYSIGLGLTNIQGFDFPPSMIKFTDFSASGAATYVLCATNGGSASITFLRSTMYVRQI